MIGDHQLEYGGGKTPQTTTDLGSGVGLSSRSGSRRDSLVRLLRSKSVGVGGLEKTVQRQRKGLSSAGRK